jgi:predicted RNA methylase
MSVGGNEMRRLKDYIKRRQVILVPFVPTTEDVVRAMLKLAELKPGETLYDLGCGDGRIILTAAQEFGANAVGVELNDRRFDGCVKKICELQLEKQVTMIHDDLLRVDLGKADVVTLYLLTSSNVKVKPNLELYLKKGARIVSHDFEMQGWKPTKVQKEPDSLGLLGHTLFLYRR